MLNLTTTFGCPWLSWPGHNWTEPWLARPCLVLSWPARGSSWVPSSPTLKEKLAHAASWQQALIETIWLLLLHLSLSINAAFLTQDKFLHIAFQIFFAYPNIAWSSWQVCVLCWSMYIILLWLDSWKVKGKSCVSLYLVGVKSS